MSSDRAIILPQLVIKDGSSIALRGDSGAALSRHGDDDVRLSKGIIDIHCWFEVALCSEGTAHCLALKADNDRFLRHSGNTRLALGNTKIEDDCLFQYGFDQRTGLMTLKGSNGQYMSRHQEDRVGLTKKEIDQHCMFAVFVP